MPPGDVQNGELGGLPKLLDLLSGAWTLDVLCVLHREGPTRFGELRRRLGAVSTKTLTERLRALEGTAFFELVRAHVLEGMFGDPSYGGNIDHAGWRLLDYPGPRRLWTAREQALDVRG